MQAYLYALVCTLDIEDNSPTMTTDQFYSDFKTVVSKLKDIFLKFEHNSLFMDSKW